MPQLMRHYWRTFMQRRRLKSTSGELRNMLDANKKHLQYQRSLTLQASSHQTQISGKLQNVSHAPHRFVTP